MKTTLLISTYNRPDALAVCLDGVLNQRVFPDEVIIGDDGSTEETAHVVSDFRARFSGQVIHVWHEDKGFRLAKIRNKCIEKASGDYIIQIDGDIMPHPSFIADHCRWARQGDFLKGSRVFLGRELTEEICADMKCRKIRLWTKGIIKKRECGFRCKVMAYLFHRYFKRHDYSGLGGNMSYWRADALAINGYDETFEGWGKEDDDFAHRLSRLGIKKRPIRFAGLAYHLWHKGEANYNMHDNSAYCSRQDDMGVIRCKNGIEKL